jgi:hypothetical protein
VEDSEAKLAAVRNLWEVNRSIFARRGFDIADRSAKWADRQRLSLDEYGPRKSFDDLCKKGCKSLPLAFLVAIIQPLRSFEKSWKEITGTPRQREQKIRAIERAAFAMEDLHDSFARVFIEGTTGESTDEDELTQLRQELVQPFDKDAVAFAMNAGVPDPASMIYALKLYASVLSMLESAQEESGAASSDMLVKYLLSAYVYRATGRFYDKEVSALIGAALDPNYDETAHRVWRNRNGNYQRIDEKLSGIVDFLRDLGDISAT